jgi:uncharacterized membrane protein YhaH (DUF805 family)
VSRTFDMQGRIGREEYARSAISMQLGAGAISIAVFAAASFAASLLGAPLWIVWVMLAALALVYSVFAAATLTLAVRRLHDLGASGWWLALGCGAGFAAVPLLFMGVAMRFSLGVPLGLALALGGSALSWTLLRRGVSLPPTAMASPRLPRPRQIRSSCTPPAET